MKYILIIWLYMGNGDPVKSIEFDTQASCQAALAAWIDHTRGAIGNPYKGMCVPK